MDKYVDWQWFIFEKFIDKNHFLIDYKKFYKFLNNC